MMRGRPSHSVVGAAMRFYAALAPRGSELPRDAASVQQALEDAHRRLEEARARGWRERARHIGQEIVVLMDLRERLR